MKLNLKYYKGKDNYSDGEIEDKIIHYIKKYPNNYEEAFKEDTSWPVFYHLSGMRKNVISWYPFKENASILEVGGGMGAITEELCSNCKSVTSIELSKRRATAILERNKEAKNLTIYVGNFEDIELNEKYDYILLNGVLEYGALYITSENPYQDFIEKLKKYLKKDGKILIAIENRFGLKYWCGASEDHTGIPFDGINNYPQSKKIKTFNKKELEDLAKSCHLNINFYYMFPDYKFPKIIYTDKSLGKNIFVNYSPYYCNAMNILIDENKLYKEIFNNQEIPFFANSYFIELSSKKEEPIVEFVKFNNDHRAKQYNLCTYLEKNKFYKKPLNKEASIKLEDIKKIDKLLQSENIQTAKIMEDKDKIYSEPVEGKNLFDLLKKEYQAHNMDEIYKIYDSIYQLIEKSGGEKVSYQSKTIFDKYGIKVEEEVLNELHFYEFGLIDIFPNNIIVSNDKYVLIDQEWLEENTPIEYTMYRAIFNFFYLFLDGDKYANLLFRKYNINVKLFEQLDKKFLENVCKDNYKILETVYRKINFIPNLTELENSKNLLQKEKKELGILNDNLQKENIRLQNELMMKSKNLESILNSRRYRFISSIADLKNKIFGKKPN